MYVFKEYQLAMFETIRSRYANAIEECKDNNCSFQSIVALAIAKKEILDQVEQDCKIWTKDMKDEFPNTFAMAKDIVFNADIKALSNSTVHHKVLDFSAESSQYKFQEEVETTRCCGLFASKKLITRSVASLNITLKYSDQTETSWLVHDLKKCQEAQKEYHEKLDLPMPKIPNIVTSPDDFRTKGIGSVVHWQRPEVLGPISQTLGR